MTRRHIGTLLELSVEESAEIIGAAKRVAQSLVTSFAPLGIINVQNNGVYAGQSVPHYHLHVVPRQSGSDWGIGPPQLARFEGFGRQHGVTHDERKDTARHRRAEAELSALVATATQLRKNLPA